MPLTKAIQRGAFVLAALFAGIVAAVCVILWQQPKPIDFLSFWAAGKMVLASNSAGIYDIAAHRAVEQSVTPVGTLPFPYPPPFALIVAPFALLPFGAAFAVWLLVTGGSYLVAARGWMRRRYAAAQPAVLINGFVGQSAFLTSALFLGGMRLLASRPLLGGALLGGLVIKPQLGLMLPIAMLAGRQWRAIGGAIASVAALLALGWLALGAGSYQAFFDLASTFGGFLAGGLWPWHELASVYAFLRFFGVPAPAALAVHGVVALIAVALVWRAWRSNREGKEAMLAAATLLGPPYLLSYDAVLLALPVAWLLNRRPALGVSVWMLSLIPVGAIFGFYEFPNTIPFAALLALIAIYRIGETPHPVTAQ
jgi:hypothetical protein